ncbi:MAG TPA: ATP-binding cassette domain-containing protein [Limnochordia bacterium]|nr:ATP-binding cassette domain-containing protein [Limnochordia bacterium]
MPQTVHAIEVKGLVKRFAVREGLPPDWGFGDAHWLISQILKRKSGLKRFEALRGVDLAVKTGELFGLLGPNGAGKTTLLKCLTTLLIPDGGTARMAGFDVRREPLAVRLSVSLVGSGHWAGFDWGLTLRENLEFFAAIYGYRTREAVRRAAWALELVDLADKAKAVPGVLSNGQRQRLALARGLMVETPILLLDEPTVGLDAVAARQVQDEIARRVRASGVTAILTTHHIDEAEALCSRVAIMDRGRVIACAPPKALIAQCGAAHVLQVTLAGLAPELAEPAGRLDGVLHAAQTPADDGRAGSLLRLRLDGPERTGAVLAWLQQQGLTVAGLRHLPPTLEDAFVALTGHALTSQPNQAGAPEAENEPYGDNAQQKADGEVEGVA